MSLLSVSVYQIHSRGFGRPEAIVKDTCPRCGFAGEMGPRYIIPSQVKNRQGETQNVWDYKNSKELYENLKEFLKHLYFRHITMKSQDRRVVVCESLLCPTVFRETLAKVLFQYFEVPSVYFVPSHLTPLYTLGIGCGLVMDVGYKEASVIPIYEWTPVLKGLQILPLAGKAIHQNLRVLLENSNNEAGDDKAAAVKRPPVDDLTEEVLEDIKVRCCFVTNINRAKQILAVYCGKEDSSKLPPSPPDVEYPFNGDSFLRISGRVREEACEILFEQDNEEMSLSTMILDSLIKCPIDTRRELAENLIITGGTCQLPGFYSRLQKELYDQLSKPRYSEKLKIQAFKFHQPPCIENYTAWLGGAIAGAMITLPGRSVSRESFMETNTLPDWCKLLEKTE
ncbi:actin-related protein 10 isoform X1 [Octopus bimaculoides]|uniref:actin-related protein 10 isoform X1 n=1 Tax=Octopus bimaculoides TaxID=37653 RepID=UPI0022E3DA92|nr:actin-related protein 10 isoform X1 [Octopus bimaculoides]